MIPPYPNTAPTTVDTAAARAALAGLERRLPNLESMAAASRDKAESLRQATATDPTQYPAAIAAAAESYGVDALLERHRADVAAAREAVFAADGTALDALRAARIAEIEETLYRDHDNFDFIVNSTNAAIRAANGATVELFQRTGTLRNEYENLIARRREFAGLTLPDAGQEFLAVRASTGVGFGFSFSVEPVMWTTQRDF